MALTLAKAKAFLGDISLVHWLASLFISFFTTWRSQGLRMMPEFGSHPVQNIMASGTVFVGTLLMAITMVRFAPKLKRWRNPHSATLIEHGGDAARITVTHYGAPATWEVRGRILRLLDGGPSPHPTLTQCYLLRDGKTYKTIALSHEECAEVHLASIAVSQWPSGGSRLAIHLGDFNGDVVPDSGAIVELVITAKPALKGGAIRRYYKVVRNREANLRKMLSKSELDTVVITEVSGD